MTANAFDFASLTGHSFSVAEKTAVQTSTTLLLSNTKMTRTKIWGKVFGFKADYLVCQCIGTHALDECITHYSVDGGLSWSMLEPNSPAKNDLCKTIQGVYMGDASYEYRVMKDDKEIAVKESERLAYFVHIHDYHCRVIPRGSQLRHEDGSIRLNTCFEGLDRTTAGKLNSYLHVRGEVKPATALEQEGVSSRVDCLDTLADDVPNGIWTLKYNPVMDCVYGSSTMFIGTVFFHVPETNQFGNVYLGDGTVNQDFAFMM